MKADWESVIRQTCDHLAAGRTILYPTDTVWGIGCDATDPEAVSRIYAIKGRPDSKALICLAGDDRMLERIIPEVPPLAWDIMTLSDKPVTIVYDHPVGVARNLVAGDDTLAVRVATDPFCRELLRRFGKPIVSTSANPSGQPTPGCFAEIQPSILSGVDYVVPLQQQSTLRSPSSILRLRADGQVQVIRA